MSYQTCCISSRLCKTASRQFRRIATSAVNNATSQPDVKVTDVSSSQKKERIVIPKKKKRNATSILKALSSTVGRDYTAPAYRYMDDPYLIPAENFSKKSYALSKASGRKAAKYLVERHRNHFGQLYDFAQPKIEAYQLKDTQYKHTETSEEAVLERVERRKVSDAIEMYKGTKTEGVTLSDPALEALLHLVCVYNSEDPPPSLEVEEMWYRRDIEGPDKKMAAWKQPSVAEEIFSSLTEKSPAAYASLMRGCAKYNNHERAWQLYCEMKDKKIPVPLSACNSLLRGCCYPREPTENKWSKVLTILKDIELSGLSPSLATFNSVLFTLSRMTRYNKSRMLALQTLAEMKACDIEPSLGTFVHILRVFYDSDSAEAPILKDVIEYVKDKEFTLKDPVDFDFFSVAMQKCYNNLQDLELAYQIDSILKCGDNYRFLGDSGKEGTYYTCFFRLICLLESMDAIMQHYEQIAPNIWSPTFTALDDLFKAIELHDGYQYIPLIWSDIVLFNFHRNAELLKSLTELLAKKQQEPELQIRLAEVARSVKNRWIRDQGSTSFRSMELTAPMMSDLIIVAARANDLDLAWELLEMTKEESRTIAGLLSGPAVGALLDICITRGETDKALKCINEMVDQGLPDVQDVVVKAKNSLQFTESQRSKLDSLSR